MKKWKCLVCGYIHEGESPPEKCPVCGAPADMFEELTEELSGNDDVDADADGLSAQADVVVVGSGAAAFSAAITAMQMGCSVIMLEKAEQIGGTTYRSGGGFWIPGNRHQKAAGIRIHVRMPFTIWSATPTPIFITLIPKGWDFQRGSIP